MHEFTITQNILSISLEKARDVQASRITKINIGIGELSGIVDDCVRLYFDFLSKDTIASRASLSFQHIPIKLQCRSCQTTFSPDKENWACPNCQKLNSEITGGRECYVENIEVEVA